MDETRSAWLARMGLEGSHVNQPVVLIAPHVFEAHGEGLFAYRRALGCRVMACDPLVPEGRLQEALAAFDGAHARQPLVWVGISRPVAQGLQGLGCTVVKVGEEPWVDLADRAPRGNRGKGIRAARNQALRGGCRVETWDRERILARREEVAEVYAAWKGLTLFSLEGSVLGTDPFTEIPGRRYFVALREERIEAVLVASPIRAGHSYYLEDLVYRRDAHRGVQELLTLAALDALAAEGASWASLGLVFLRKLERSALGDPVWERRLARFQRVVHWFYNADGQDLFRRRFQVARWEPAYLAFRGGRPAPGAAPRGPVPLVLVWGLLAVLASLEPRLRWPGRRGR